MIYRKYDFPLKHCLLDGIAAKYQTQQLFAYCYIPTSFLGNLYIRLVRY
jgi:hypothetical protein